MNKQIKTNIWEKGENKRLYVSYIRIQGIAHPRRENAGYWDFATGRYIVDKNSFLRREEAEAATKEIFESYSETPKHENTEYENWKRFWNIK